MASGSKLGGVTVRRDFVMMKRLGAGDGNCNLYSIPDMVCSSEGSRCCILMSSLLHRAS